MNLRTVRTENGYVAVQRPGETVAGIQCWETIGAVRYVPPPGHGCYTAFDAGGNVLRLCPDMETAIDVIVACV